MKKDVSIDPRNLEVVEHEGAYALFYGDEMIMCRGGKALMHSDGRLLKHLIDELDGQGGVELLGDGTLRTKGVTAYDFIGVRRSLQDGSTPVSDERFRLWLAADPTLRTVPGPESMEQRVR